jgi:hypothetical protein
LNQYSLTRSGLDFVDDQEEAKFLCEARHQHLGKDQQRKHGFIENNITRNINPTCRNIKALETFMQGTIPKKGAL